VRPYEVIAVERLGGVSRITLDRPDALNAWTPELGRELLDALRTAATDPNVRAVLVTGAGRAFSAGADVKVPREITADGDPDLSTRLQEIYNPIMVEIRHAPKPVIAAVNGPAAGLGCSLALACDLTLAAESAYFLLAFARLGVMPDGGACLFLAERIGLARTAELAICGEPLPAPQALDWGLINAVHPDDRLAGTALELAERLADGPTLAYANIKRTLRAASQASLIEHLAFEASLQQEHATSADYAEGVRAFIERRPPRFTGC
jgi:2-(1,2-epoxy-1,2-dihydrophenyl)acetyl-CoA isomerase